MPLAPRTKSEKMAAGSGSYSQYSDYPPPAPEGKRLYSCGIYATQITTLAVVGADFYFFGLAGVFPINPHLVCTFVSRDRYNHVLCKSLYVQK